jgi:tRNA uridine 5-carboxymethylaminomethyl modification enzyme
MFTSRAEYRTLLRQDDADARLTPLSYQIGLASEERMINLERKTNASTSLIYALKERSVTPGEANEFLISKDTSPLKQAVKAIDILARPQVSILELLENLNMTLPDIPESALISEAIEEAEIIVKYAGYIEREKTIADKLKRLESIKIYPDFDFKKIASLSTEARQKLSRIKPGSIGQASRISGITPSDINVLLVHLGR